MFTTILIVLVLILVGSGIYFFPVSRVPFNTLYAAVPEDIRRSLQRFRGQHALRQVRVDGVDWDYISLGDGKTTILLLHGMGGGYDIWWQQIEALRQHYRVIAPTYPPVHSLAGLSRGIRVILNQEQVVRFNVVGSSLGGYLAQYLIAEHPGRIQKAVFANTFPPNDIFAKKTKISGKLLPFLPEWLVMRNLRKTTAEAIYPASGNSALVAAYMMEQSHGMMRKAQFVARFHCVLDYFPPPDQEASSVEILIVEADNDPLVVKTLREMLKTTYPSARIITLQDAGHFPYLNRTAEYTNILEEFFDGN
jgi:maspardin